MTVNEQPTEPQAKPKRAGLIAGALAVLTLVGYGVTADKVVDNQERPAALATALYGPGEGEANLIVYKDGRIEQQPVEYDKDGHGSLPKWEGKGLPAQPWTAQIAPVMGWNPPYMADVVAGRRGLRYCANELRQYGGGMDVIGIRAVQEVWDEFFQVQPSTEDCNNPDLILGANAESDCGSMAAWGCASFNGRTTRVTFNGTLHRQGTISTDAIRLSIMYHEYKHAFDLGHVGVYGNEGGPHAHLSDMSSVCPPYPCDNRSGRPAVEDYDDGAGRARWGLQPRGANPTPTPTPSPRPTGTTPPVTPRPTPPPTPSPPPQARVETTVYSFPWTAACQGRVHTNGQGQQFCARDVALPAGQWAAIEQVGADGQRTRLTPVIVLPAAGPASVIGEVEP